MPIWWSGWPVGVDGTNQAEQIALTAITA